MSFDFLSFMVSQFNAIKAKPLTLALSQRERGLTELSG